MNRSHDRRHRAVPLPQTIARIARPTRRPRRRPNRCTPAPRSRTALAVCLLLILAVALVFGETLRFDFVNYDDNLLVYENPIVARGVTAHGLAWAFTTSAANMWYPLTWISYMLDSQVYGMQPWGYHLTNVLLHAATAVVLFLALRRMTGSLWSSAWWRWSLPSIRCGPKRWPGWANGRAP